MKLCQQTVKLIRANTPLNINEQVNINHEHCPAGNDTKRRLYIRRTIDSVLAYCHHCGGHSVLKNNTRLTTSQIKERLINKYKAPTNDEVLLPADITYEQSEWPVAERTFIKQWFDWPDVMAYAIGYSPSLGRVIFPYFQTGKCVFWQGRDVPQRTGLKWLTASSAQKPLGVYWPPMVSNTIVIVEDVISALHLSNSCGVNAMCLYGTSMGDHQLEWLVEAGCFSTVIVWLDNDHAGQEAKLSLAQRLAAVCPRSTSIHTTNVMTPQPKNLPTDALTHVLARF